MNTIRRIALLSDPMHDKLGGVTVHEIVRKAVSPSVIHEITKAMDGGGHWVTINGAHVLITDGGEHLKEGDVVWYLGKEHTEAPEMHLGKHPHLSFGDHKESELRQGKITKLGHHHSHLHDILDFRGNVKVKNSHIVGKVNGAMPSFAFKGWVTLDDGRKIFIDDDKVRSALNEQIASGGFSSSISGEKAPSSGFMVAMPGHEESFTATSTEEMAAKAGDYAERHARALSEPNRYVGGWIDSGKLYLDVSEHISDRTGALKAGRERDQIAIFDLSKGDSVFTMSDQQRPSESKGDANKAKTAPVRFFVTPEMARDKAKMVEILDKVRR